MSRFAISSGTHTRALFQYVHGEILSLSMLRFRNILVNTNSNIPSELHTRNKITNQNILFINKIHVEKVRERFTIKNSNDVRINVCEERKRRRNIGTEHCTFVFFLSCSEEIFWFLEPEIV